MSGTTPLTPALSPAPAGERGTTSLVVLLSVLLAACGVKANPRPPEPRPAAPSRPAAAPVERGPATAAEKAP